jgi:translocation and assembly module TamB
MDIELAGDLRVVQKGSNPTVTGTLKAQQGRLSFLGRTFSVDRGEVTFFGDDELNPSLDIRLTTKVGGTEVIVTFTGTAEEPKLELTSTPELSEADIMSVLLFGDSSDKLTGDQLELVGQRAAAIAATYGAAEVEGMLAGPLGVDMLTLNPSGPEGSTTVMVGKYLSRRALLKYEQALDSEAGFFVTLEYTLMRNLTLETMAGTQQSGAEINWSKDY